MSMAGAQDHAAAYFASSPSSSINRSPDTASLVYPDRAIRPLPRSRLKSKLSPEQVSTIVYPLEPPPRALTLNFNARENGSTTTSPAHMTNGDAASYHSPHHHHEHRTVHSHCTCGEHGDSGDEEVEFDHPDFRYPPLPQGDGVPAKSGESPHQRLLAASRSSTKPPPPGSAASSADGYESFENTSNKKKRKIPLSGVSNLHQSQLSAEMANMGINGHGDETADASNSNTPAGEQQSPQHYNHASSGSISAGSGTGISGAGRGRYGRQEARARRPLGSSTMNAINGYNPRAPSRGNDDKHGQDGDYETTGGIISQAIKTAAEQGPLTPVGKGKENMSLLHATKLVDHHPSNSAYSTGSPTPTRTGPPVDKSHGTQTMSSRNPTPQYNNRAPPAPSTGANPNGNHQQNSGVNPAPAPKPRPRRNPSKEYALQALNRQKQQQYQNWHSRIKPEDMWICEFCEYEDIYGVPPLALIRQYEIKDRQERKKAAEKRRLLEKAKMKGRKNKKSGAAGKVGKNGSNGVNNAGGNGGGNINSHHQDYDPNLHPLEPGEEYYDDEDEDGDELDDDEDDEDYDGDEYEPVPGGGMDDHYPDPRHQEYYHPPPASRLSQSAPTPMPPPPSRSSSSLVGGARGVEGGRERRV
ncbi:uncharacterized protein K489DRAFT_358660 [Dissoconium aciculare CBS 342.82]|uniref:Uncharacterized protein n=1 Tax=Dissoconium aciculare CBS 342.82 TaxID=1314786 RepID=A0A6J3M4L7_9PEZI|nr:uncharacterized protein K489DRAFT_358660 [Dissoconium aciculare CBS 342.82]KAF1822429.1 hypothetical protein K489DRAFT_358660 [Dissoconium aciculare CBS 342.82]